MEFIYKAKNSEGKIVSGKIDAESSAEASTQLRDQKLYIVEIKTTEKDIKGKLFKKKISVKDKIIFTQQLGVMITAGISIIDALEALKEETENETFSDQIKKIITDLKGGTPFSKALAAYPETFTEIYVNMVKSGEESGKIDTVLKRLSVQLEKEYEINRKIKSALLYPIIVCIALVVVLTLVIVVIIPQLKVIFDDAGVSLPASTKFLIFLSNALIHYGLYILAIGVVAFIFAKRFKKTPKGKRYFDKLALKIPVFGDLLKKSYMARFTRTFASLVASGLPLLDVFRVSRNIIGNVLYEDEINEMIVEVKAGKTVSSALRGSPLFPKMISQLAAVGEKSGSTDQVFDTLADFFDRDVDTMTTNLSTLLEPIIMLVMGAGIGFVIISVLQPIYGLVNAV